MADEQTPPPADPPSPPPEPPKPPDERVYSKTELDAIVRGKVAEAQRKAAKPNKPEPSDDLAARLAAIEEHNRRLTDELTWASALASTPEAARLSASQKALLRKAFDPASPEALADLIRDNFATPAPPESKPVAPALPGIPFTAGAPSGAPREVDENPLKWSRADIDRMKARGEFLPAIERFRSTLPGGSSLFRRKVPKG